MQLVVRYHLDDHSASEHDFLQLVDQYFERQAQTEEKEYQEDPENELKEGEKLIEELLESVVHFLCLGPDGHGESNLFLGQLLQT